MLAINWDWVYHADALLLFIFLLVWSIIWLAGVIGRGPGPGPGPRL
jgi:hypothetical protein